MSKSTKQQRPQGICIFCQGHGMTKQHMWPNWMGQNPELPTHRTISSSSTQMLYNLTQPLFIGKKLTIIKSPEIYTKNRQGHIGTTKVRLVCNRCNNGWMSKVEQDSQQIITKLMLNKSSSISVDEQRKLVSWLTQMSIVSEFTHIPTKAITYQEREFFHIHKMPPANGWYIWIGKYGGVDWVQRYRHYGARVEQSSNRSANELISDAHKLGVNYQFTQIGLGEFVAFILSSSSQLGNKIKETVPMPSAMVQIWPALNKHIDWAAREVLSDQDVTECGDKAMITNSTNTFRRLIDKEKSSPNE